MKHRVHFSCLLSARTKAPPLEVPAGSVCSGGGSAPIAGRVSSALFRAVAALGLLVVLRTGTALGSAYGIPLNTIDGGGGPSAGGNFLLNGTIGQADAGARMSGGAFAVSGGFWPGVAIAVDPAPRLSIRLGAPSGGINTVILFWPNPSTGYVLEQTANMSAPGGGWSDVQQAPAIVGPNKEVTLQATGQFCLFRLRRL